MRVLLFAAAVGVCAVLARAASTAEATPKPLELRTLTASVVRVGSLHGSPLYGVRVRGYLCSRTSAEADRSNPSSFRIAHYVTPGRKPTGWGKAFRVVDNDLYPQVPLGETRGACGYVTFEDVIPPENYGGVESPLGALGYGSRYRCYGVQLTLRATLLDPGNGGSKPVAATGRAIVRCGRFHLP